MTTCRRYCLLLCLPLLLGAGDTGLGTKDKRSSTHGDEGYFAGGSATNFNAMVIWPDDPHNLIRRYRPDNNPNLSYRFSINAQYEHGTRGTVINMMSEERFAQALSKWAREDDKDMCIWVDNPWVYKTVGQTPTACGSHTVTQRAQCDLTGGTCDEALNCADRPPDKTVTIENEVCGPTDPQDPVQCSPGNWTPLRNTVCQNVEFTQTDQVCQTTRTTTGTKTGGDCCVSDDWSPSRSTQCTSRTFTQTNACGHTRQVTGTIPSNWSPPRSSVCLGQSFTQTNSCGTTRTRTGTKTSGDCCVGNNWSPSASTQCQGSTFTQTNECGHTRTATGTKSTTWSPPRSTVCAGSSFTQTNTCGATRTVTGTKPAGSWTPAASTQCVGTSVIQTNACGQTRTVDGTKPPNWWPPANTKCEGVDFQQTSACNQTRIETGTKTDGPCVKYQDCPSGTRQNCQLPSGTHGNNSTGTCVNNTTGSCTYRCYDGSWSKQANSCRVMQIPNCESGTTRCVGIGPGNARVETCVNGNWVIICNGDACCNAPW